MLVSKSNESKTTDLELNLEDLKTNESIYVF